MQSYHSLPLIQYYVYKIRTTHTLLFTILPSTNHRSMLLNTIHPSTHIHPNLCIQFPTTHKMQSNIIMYVFHLNHTFLAMQVQPSKSNPNPNNTNRNADPTQKSTPQSIIFYTSHLFFSLFSYSSYTPNQSIASNATTAIDTDAVTGSALALTLGTARLVEVGVGVPADTITLALVATAAETVVVVIVLDVAVRIGEPWTPQNSDDKNDKQNTHQPPQQRNQKLTRHTRKQATHALRRRARHLRRGRTRDPTRIRHGALTPSNLHDIARGREEIRLGEGDLVVSEVVDKISGTNKGVAKSKTSTALGRRSLGEDAEDAA